ncbi:hypothetical protein [Nocardia lijiangensis]|uniref:hypothetical protein n=1 Tax=Nocardia lijiangensis TaxID=299618 RepID=UPI0009FE5E4E|nr:hypothetical protein [Nocardia lijiangensis]
MNPTSRYRLGVLAVVAFTGPIAAAGLLACSSTEPTASNPETSAAVATAPTGLHWQSFQGLELPVTDQGPQHADGAVVRGFERSPAGAALAAVHASVRMSIALDSAWAAVGQQMLAPGPGRDAWATARAQISITAPITEGAPKLLGYRVTRYTPDASDIEVYSLHPDNSATCHDTQVLWQREDWRLHLPENPTTSPITAVTSPPTDMVAFTPR